MYVFDDAQEFIKNFEAAHKVKILRVPFSLSVSQTVALLMCKMGQWYVSMPYISQGVLELNPKRFDLPELPKYWEIRDTRQRSKNVYSSKVNIELDLRDEYNYTTNIRRKIHKAQANDIIVRNGADEKIINDFYTAYSVRMHEIGVPPQSKQSIKKGVLLSKAEVFVAYIGSEPIGGATLCRITNDYYDNALFATIEKYQHLYPSYLLHSAMIDYSRQSKAATYSFGRSTLGSSVHEFKSHFHCKEIPLYWSYSHHKRQARNNKWFFSIYRLLPYRLSILFGGIIQRKVY
jgi:hypothetical protein